jgi:AcrR family transcriptional regulator
MKSKRQLVSDFRRREILDAARSVFARRGFAQGIVDEIASEAKLAKGTIYLYFKSKREIYRAVLQHDMEALKKSTLERIDRASGLKEKIQAFVLARLENAEARREFFRIMDSQSASLSLTRSQYRDWMQEPVSRLAAAIEEAQKRGEIRPVPAERVAWIVADISRGAIQRRLLGQNDMAVREEAEFLTELIWAALKAGIRSSAKGA